jgi:hypothetical protein
MPVTSVHRGHVGVVQSQRLVPDHDRARHREHDRDLLFLAALTRSGRIWLQTLPIAKFARALERYMPHEARRQTVEGGVVGGIVGSILDNMK